MKRYLSLLLILLLCLCAVPAFADTTEINSVDGLKAIAQDPSGDYVLTGDIDLAGIDWTPIPFSGTLDGNGHTIYNLTVTKPGPDTRITQDGNLKEYETVFAGLFSAVEHADISDLKLKGVYVDIVNDTHCFASGLCGYIADSRITDCYVSGRIRMVNNAVMAGVAGFAGFGYGDFKRDQANVELVFEDRNFSSKCEEFLGAILSCGIGNITDCMVDIDGYDSCHGYVHNGGLCGMYYHCGTGGQKGVINGNFINGRIWFFEDNIDRRAYCEPTAGEHLNKPEEEKNNTSSFESKETKDYNTVLLPEMCENPVYTETVVAPTEYAWGYTKHECSGCGYHWNDTYVPN